MLYGVLGPMGGGKSYVLAWIARNELRGGRRVYCNFKCEGTRPWPVFSDVATRAFQDCVFELDESGTSYNARQTLDFSRVDFAALTMQRKHSNDMYVAFQHGGFCDINFKRVMVACIVVSRAGYDGREILLGHKTWFWRRPWWFMLEWYLVTDFDSDWELKPGAKPYQSKRLWWSRKIAESYDTTEVVVPPELATAFRRIEKGAESRYNLPVVGSGVVSRADLESVEIPVFDANPRKLSNPDDSLDYLYERFYQGGVASRNGRVRKVKERLLLKGGSSANGSGSNAGAGVGENDGGALGVQGSGRLLLSQRVEQEGVSQRDSVRSVQRGSGRFALHSRSLPQVEGGERNGRDSVAPDR